MPAFAIRDLAGGGQAPLPASPRGGALVARAGGAGPRASMLGGMASVVNINDVLDGHVALEVECVDRLYLERVRARTCRWVVRWSGS